MIYAAEMLFCLQRDGRHEYSEIAVVRFLAISSMCIRTTACANTMYLEQKTIPRASSLRLLLFLCIRKVEYLSGSLTCEQTE